MNRHYSFDHPVKVTYRDLLRLGIVRHRPDLHFKIKAGKIRPPYKSGPRQQSGAWWYWADILEDIERERAELEQQQK
ncbi:hypothetical protein GOD64_10890 [Sinorhizobium medicae]|nr:hypothetical protein [Sinorhizobium medicae]MDX0671884.1 hypothetical protein [Sinorhizobium medicae]MDX0709164.1 hypothetical protein [Sinorhizobium medicae]MDX0719346.1 hypothetical protein [Sinorhizobium medicae]MDX1218526.1 hypothetical protein [Sinorhizobium medicae]